MSSHAIKFQYYISRLESIRKRHNQSENNCISTQLTSVAYFIEAADIVEIINTHCSSIYMYEAMCKVNYFSFQHEFMFLAIGRQHVLQVGDIICACQTMPGGVT